VLVSVTAARRSVSPSATPSARAFPPSHPPLPRGSPLSAASSRRFHAPGRRLAIFMCAGALALAAASLGVASGGRPSRTPSVTEIIQGCQSFGSRIASARAHFRVEIDERRSVSEETEPKRQAPKAVTGTWVLKGNRFREETRRSFPKETPEARAARRQAGNRAQVMGTAPAPPPSGEVRQVVVFDGVVGISAHYRNGAWDQGERFTGPEAAAEAAGLCEFWRWLGIMPPKAPSATSWIVPPAAEDNPEVMGTERAAGVECVKVSARAPRGANEVKWWVAPNYDYLVLRKDEVKYFKPEKGLQPGQSVLIRTRVTSVRSFGAGIYLPVAAERTVAWVNRDGSLARVLRRWRFTASDVQVNGRISDRAFTLAGPASQSSSVGTPPKQELGCDYGGLLDFCSLMNVRLDAGEATALARWGIAP